MVKRGGFSFVAMMVINPVIILFYQNCSMSQVSYASASKPAKLSRAVASEPKQKKSNSSCSHEIPDLEAPKQ